MNATVKALWLKPAKRQPMQPVSTVSALAGRGLADNADLDGRRQVTLLATAAWAAAERELGRAVGHDARRANILIDGVDLQEATGKIIELGPVAIRILGETKPCARMDEACAGLRKALEPEWRAGAHGEVLNDGSIAVGDAVQWSDA